MSFIVKAKTIVTIALAVEAKNAVRNTPFSCHVGVRTKRNPIGNTSVPKNEVSKERTGRSSAVKKDEKHISTQPVIYESENNFIPIMLTAKRFVSSRFTNKGATYSPTNIINNNDAAESTIEPRMMRLKMALTLLISPAP